MKGNKVSLKSLHDSLSDPKFESSIDNFVRKYMPRKNREENITSWRSLKNRNFEKTQEFLDSIIAHEGEFKGIHISQKLSKEEFICSVYSLAKVKRLRSKIKGFEQVIGVCLSEKVRDNFSPERYNLPIEFNGYRVEYVFPTTSMPFFSTLSVGPTYSSSSLKR